MAGKGDQQIGTIRKRQQRSTRRPASKSRTKKVTDNKEDHKNRNTTSGKLFTRCNFCEAKQYNECRHCRISNHSIAEKPNTNENCNFCDRQRKRFYKKRQEKGNPRNNPPNTSIPPPDRRAFNPPVPTPNLTKQNDKTQGLQASIV